MDAMAQNFGSGQVSERTTEQFIAFMRLLTKHFVEHHDIGFYAERLHITPIHLSRIVRQVTGRTVVDYINQMLLMEASWLLQTTNLSIAAIAERLHFADQSSFGRFFARIKGIAPKAYRLELTSPLNLPTAGGATPASETTCADRNALPPLSFFNRSDSPDTSGA